MSNVLLPMDTRRQLLRALKTRYQAASKAEKTRILEEFIQISGYHRKSAIRLLNGAVTNGSQQSRSATARSIYGAAVQQALIVLWEASDRLCGKRLRALLPQLIPAMEKHGHLSLNPALREQLMKISASSIDRLLKEAHTTAGKKRNRVVNRLSKSIPVRMFTEHERHSPGFMEMDLVAHCGRHLSGTFLWTLSLTDIASGWTECVALPARNAELIIRAVDKVQKILPFPLLGLDVDNGAEFINEALFEYCSARCIALTRSRPYRKNDQAWIEQKNGSVVRKLAGYGRLDGEHAVKAMNQMYMANRLFINFFQPSFKLLETQRIGGKTVRRHDAPKTPYNRLIELHTLRAELRRHFDDIIHALDPLKLLETIRLYQHQLARIAVGDPVGDKNSDLTAFLQGLSVAWQEGAVNPLHHPAPSKPRHWRTRADPFADVWNEIECWLKDEPQLGSTELLLKLEDAHPGKFTE
ncbi:transposase family protein, partial [Salmonella enterica]|nr:transposase family protein [Salmonella enterica]EJX4304697.1 transposase family protein [Salmonella enterica]EJX4360287.1 transposase family protein [Salmonella enterica]EJX4517240.1 transposase family protein [Salmonella enterica]EJX4527201.1 transposase family protein [Salmonella enterica]